MELMTEEYKKTELGSIPEDWIICRFEDVMDGFSSGQTPYREVKRYYDGNIPWITSGELNYNIITDTIEKITPEAVQKTNLKMIPKGTFLMAITGLEAEGTRGSCAITGIDVTTNQSCMALYPKKGLLITDYLFHFYRRYGNFLALKYCQGTKQQSYTGAIAKTLPIILPPSIEEQTAIANALSDADALINSLEKLIVKKKNIKRGAVQEFIKPNKGWVEKRLGDCLVAYPDYGINAAAVDYSDILPTYLRITDISEDGNFLQTKKASVNHPLANQYCLEEGDIVFARTGASVGKTYLYNSSDGKLVFAGFLIRVKVNPNLLIPKYLKIVTETTHYWNWVKVMSMRSGQPGINGAEYAELPISLPPLPEQIRIVTIISDIEDEIAILEQKLEKQRQLKQGMMQNLLTGKIRLI